MGGDLVLILHLDNKMSGISLREPERDRTVFTVSLLGSTLGNFIMWLGRGKLSPEVICDNNYNECDISLSTTETVKGKGSVNVHEADKCLDLEQKVHHL